MKCTRQPKFLANKPVQISDTWEVRLSPRIWNNIRQLAVSRQSTLTAVTRYCLFSMIEVPNLRMRRPLRQCLQQTINEARSSNTLHRHIICFYGEDLVLVKLTAMRLGVTVSALVRIALCLFLPRLAAEIQNRHYVSEEHYYTHSIKRWMRIVPSALNLDRIPMMRGFAFASFPPWFWW